MITKKLLAVIISALLIVSVVPFVPFTSFAETEGIYTYRIDYGRAKIINVDKSVSGDIIVPATLGGYPVTAIGKSIYWNGESGEGWQRPSLTEVNGGSSAFQSCDKITSITIPKSVTKIDSDSFIGCSKLSEIIVESGNPVYIALNNCLVDATTKTIISGCMNSVIPNDDRVASIDEYSFAGCSGLKSITIPDNITSIGKDAFHSCVGLESLVIGNGITEIKSNTFHDCKSLKSVIWGQSIKTIAKKAFLGCESLENIILPDSVESIEYGAFCDCKKLSNIKLGANLISIDGWVFCGCSSLANISVSANNANYYVTGNCLISNEWKSVVLGCKNSTIPEDDNVNGISYVAFAGCEALEEITIPKNIEFIGEEAFEDCINLKTVNMEFGLKVIGHGAFRNCTSLNGVVLPESLVAFGEDGLSPAGGIFMNCKSLQNINIPKGVTSIYNGAFRDCTGLTTVEIGDSVEYIGYGAFSGCTGITSISIPDSVSRIDMGAFSGCINITKLTIPDSVTIIGDDSFSNCTGLTTVKIGNSVEYIGYGAFSGCTKITSIKIPDSVTTIDSYAFSDCEKLEQIEISDSLISIGWYAFQKCTHLTTIIIPDSVTDIGLFAFTSCENLTDIYYTGTESQKETINIMGGNEKFIDAAWHYNFNPDTDCTHTKTIWEVIEKATLKEKGLKQRVCSKCGAILGMQDIEKLEDTYSLASAKTNISENISVAPSALSNISVTAEIKAKKTEVKEKSITYDIYIEDGGEVTQPEAPVLVKLPIPAGFDKDKLNIYRTESDGRKTRLDFIIDGDYAYFETDHFSIYEIIEKLCGDISGDGNLNNQDLVILFQYLSGWDVADQIDKSAVDINGDGKENNQDLVLLFQYLSGWEVEIF